MFVITLLELYCLVATLATIVDQIVFDVGYKKTCIVIAGFSYIQGL